MNKSARSEIRAQRLEYLQQILSRGPITAKQIRELAALFDCNPSTIYGDIACLQGRISNGQLERNRASHRKTYARYKDKYKSVGKRWRALNNSRLKEYMADYRATKSVQIRHKAKIYLENHREKRKTAMENWRSKNADKEARWRHDYYAKNKQTIIESRSVRYRNDPTFAITQRLRARVLKALNSAGVRREHRFLELVGCTPQKLKAHLESLFKEGMSWERRNEWHIDHIRPCSSFDLTDPEQQKLCFHYTNLQPLWAKDNLKKHSKYSD